MIYTRHPTDESSVIGQNGHTYAATRLPETGWEFAQAWGILDLLRPDAIPIDARLFLCGLIAGALRTINDDMPPAPLAPSAEPPASEPLTRILAQCRVPDELANAWLQHLRDFDAAHPGCHFEVMMQSGRDVPVHEMVETLRVNPELTIQQVFERTKATPAPAKPVEPSPFDRAAAAIRANPQLSDRAIERQFGVSHQTVARARAAIEREAGPSGHTMDQHGPGEGSSS